MGAARRRRIRLRLHCEQFRGVENKPGGPTPASEPENTLFAGKHDILAAGLHDRIVSPLKPLHAPAARSKPQPRGRSYEAPCRAPVSSDLVNRIEGPGLPQ